VVTNVPYLTRGKQHEVARHYSETHYSDAKNDLANVFLERCLELSQKQGSGVAQIVMPQNWLFLTSYKKQRESLLTRAQWNLLARLGEGGFASSQAAGAFIILLTLTKVSATAEFQLCGLDASAPKSPQEKAALLREGELVLVNQKGQLANPDATISLEDLAAATPRLSAFADVLQGVSTTDSNRFVVRFWETEEKGKTWELYQVAPSASGMPYTSLMKWEGGNGALAQIGTALKGRQAVGRRGLAVAVTRTPIPAMFWGTRFDGTGAVIIPKQPEHFEAIAAYFNSPSLNENLRAIDQALSITESSFGKVPFDLAHWKNVAAEHYPSGIPKPYSDDPTQWFFHGHPQSSTEPLQAAVARLAGYRWPAETDASMELSDEAQALITSCEALVSHTDEDGIVCLPSVRGEPSAHERLSKLLTAAFGSDWSSARERELLLATAVANNARKPEPSLEAWLRNSFFGEHCKLFQSRPFVWQVWDGNPTGFSALVNAHKLAAPNGQGRKTLELLTFTYLGDWIDRQMLDQAEGVNGADDRLAAALDLQAQLKKILEGEPPYDIFVRWKPLQQQAIGWDPDINDGVRLNIRPFLSAQLRKGGKTGAGILRAKPGAIKWAKDRGKEPSRSKEEFPWFWGWDENSPAMATDFGAPASEAPPAGDSFDGNRWNDLHYTLAAKEAARARHSGGPS
jgi:hypothetical protein